MYPEVTFQDAAYVIPAGTTAVAQTGTMTAARAVTLPAASSLAAGSVLIVRDASGTVSAANKLTVGRAGADTINGGIVGIDITVPCGYLRLVSNGVSAWTATGDLALGRPGIRSGLGTPLGVVVAPVGTLYTRLDGGAGTTLYVKESGIDATGWVAK